MILMMSCFADVELDSQATATVDDNANVTGFLDTKPVTDAVLYSVVMEGRDNVSEVT